MLWYLHAAKSAFLLKIPNMYVIVSPPAAEDVCEAFKPCVGRELDSSDGILPTKIFTHR
jgi:hypothetical protein